MRRALSLGLYPCLSYLVTAVEYCRTRKLHKKLPSYWRSFFRFLFSLPGIFLRVNGYFGTSPSAASAEARVCPWRRIPERLPCKISFCLWTIFRPKLFARISFAFLVLIFAGKLMPIVSCKESEWFQTSVNMFLHYHYVLLKEYLKFSADYLLADHGAGWPRFVGNLNR